MLLNNSISFDVSDIDPETMKEIVELEDTAPQNIDYTSIIVFCCCLLLAAYLLYFKYELVYKITESWKSYSSSDCSDLYIFNCKSGAIVLLVIAIYFLINIFFDFQFDLLWLFT